MKALILVLAAIQFAGCATSKSLFATDKPYRCYTTYGPIYVYARNPINAQFEAADKKNLNRNVAPDAHDEYKCEEYDPNKP